MEKYQPENWQLAGGLPYIVRVGRWPGWGGVLGGEGREARG